MPAIRISEETREMLKKIGNKDETYDEVIRRLIEEHRRDKE